MKKTPWLHSRPYHSGVYQRKTIMNQIVYSFWNGKHWGQAGSNPDQAVFYKNRISIFQSMPWCGLANPEHDRRNIGPFVSAIANANPKWSHRKVLNAAKVACINRDARRCAGASTKGFDPSDMLTSHPSEMVRWKG